ncbi:MAG: hypothetical protein KDK56_05740 [Simkania sp.]|nr:hypothetical protein [Simkania sp.]MCP5490851.1 hypothetical protein [Chlamydiales bacterium]
MTTPIGQTAISGIYIGGLVAVSPPTIALLTAGSNVFKAIIAGILVNTVTDGRMDSAFNILITSPRLWHLMLYTVPLGCAISVISALGFYFSEGRCPNYHDLFGRTTTETSEV